MESATWRYLRWFYDQMEVIYVPSRAYCAQLVAKGFAAEKLQLFPHGTDIDRYHPRHRQPEFWDRYGGTARLTITYVGRVAREKDLDVLVPVFDALARGRPDCRLAIVGDGPFMEAMRHELPHPNVVFTGFLFDSDLSAAYATSDIFVFPSTTDTFGNVVLEAMASGVPVVCSDKGGPSEIVQDGRTGLVTRARSASDLLAAVEHLIESPALRQEMSLACRAYAETCGWDRIYWNFWRGDQASDRAMPPAARAQAV
jgi:glycosyltransferase involved in cell wall biosynthesis